MGEVYNLYWKAGWWKIGIKVKREGFIVFMFCIRISSSMYHNEMPYLAWV